MIIFLCLCFITLLSVIMAINLKNIKSQKSDFSFLDERKKSLWETIKTDPIIGRCFCPIWIAVLICYLIFHLIKL